MIIRPRRLRQSPAIRAMVRETTLSPNDFIYPLFVKHGHDIKDPITSMPGQFHFSVDRIAAEAAEIRSLGIPALILFGLPDKKDAHGSRSYADDGVTKIKRPEATHQT